MDTIKGVLVILILLLGGTGILLYIQYSAASAQLDSASLQSKATLDLLRLQGASCGAGSSEFAKITKCIEPLLLAKDFKEEGFSQPDGTRNIAGYLIIKNINRREYDAENFALMLNRQLVQEGCAIPGKIGYNSPCKFSFKTYCQKGDLFEAFYRTNDTAVPGTKIYSKIC